MSDKRTNEYRRNERDLKECPKCKNTLYLSRVYCIACDWLLSKNFTEGEK